MNSIQKPKPGRERTAGTRISAIFTTGRPHGRASGGMTMDLIDRAAAIDAIVSISIYEDEWAIRRACSSSALMKNVWIGGVNDAIEVIKEVNAVEAVPLDKLCEWLESNAKYKQDGKIRADQWNYVLTKWMEEQDATD